MTLKELIELYSYQNEGVYTLIDIEKLCKEYAELFRIKILEEVQCYEDYWTQCLVNDNCDSFEELLIWYFNN